MDTVLRNADDHLELSDEIRRRLSSKLLDQRNIFLETEHSTLANSRLLLHICLRCRDRTDDIFPGKT